MIYPNNIKQSQLRLMKDLIILVYTWIIFHNRKLQNQTNFFFHPKLSFKTVFRAKPSKKNNNKTLKHTIN